MQNRIRGRGTSLNPVGRFEEYDRQPCEDIGSDFGDGLGEEPLQSLQSPQPLQSPTEVTYEQARSLINRHNSPDLPFRATINPYRGCEHGCIYCYARPYHAYVGLSSGLDFETKIFAKSNAAEALAAQLSRASYRAEPLVIGASTDPYQPIERRLAITRDILKVLWEHRHPVSIITKSALILRDLDIIAEMAARRLIAIFISITTLRDDLAHKMEPRAAAPALRLKALEGLSQAGAPTAVMFAPLIPALNDMEMEQVLEAASQRGAQRAFYTMLRLPYEVRELFEDWLKRHFPKRAAHVLKLLRDCHGGKLYNSQWGQRRSGRGSYAAMIAHRFALARRRLGLDCKDFSFDFSQFRSQSSCRSAKSTKSAKPAKAMAKRSKSREQDSLQYTLALPSAEG